MLATICLTNNLTLLPVCLAFVQSFAALHFKDKTLTNRILLSTEEAFCHTVEQAYEPGETGQIIIEAKFADNGLKLTFNDLGLPFDPAVLDQYNPATAHEEPDFQALGLFLIQQSADEVKWEHQGTKGNLLSLFFYDSYKDITQIDGGNALKVNNSDKAPAPKQDYTIRLARADEAIHISRCMYRAYGYSYLVEDMYYPKKIGEKIRNKSQISVVAISQNGEIVGHCALESRVKDILVESGQAVINPHHRGRKLLERMKAFLNTYAAEIGLSGIYSEPVTNHTRSQQASLKTGNYSCGLMLGYLPKTLQFKKMDQQTKHHRRSCVYNYMPLKSTAVKKIHVSAAYHKLVKTIYADCGIPITIDTTGCQPAVAISSISSVFLPSTKIGIISVTNIGTDCVEQIKQGLFRLTMKTSAEMVYLNLPLENGAVVNILNRVRALGFVFCTVAIALNNGRDVLRLQYLNCEIDFDDIHLVGDTAAQIYNFIKAERNAVENSGEIDRAK